MNTMVCRAIAPLFVVIAAFDTPAAAQDKDEVMAEVYFESGIKAMEEGKFDIGCPDLERSQKLDPQPGTLFALADCERQWGRLTAALKDFDDYLLHAGKMNRDKREKHAQRINMAKDHKAGLLKVVPKLFVVLPSYVPADAKVFRDGTPLTTKTLGDPLFVDPGDHVIRLEVEGMPPIERTVHLEKGDTKWLDLVPPEEPAEPTVAPTVPVEQPKAPEPRAPEKKTMPTKEKVVAKQSRPGIRIAGFGALGVGLAGVAVGSVTGWKALQAKETFDKKCPNDGCVNPADVDAWAQGQTMANVSTAGFAVGLAGLGTGVLLLVMSRGKSEQALGKPGVQAIVIDAGLSGGSFGVRGVF